MCLAHAAKYDFHIPNVIHTGGFSIQAWHLHNNKLYSYTNIICLKRVVRRILKVLGIFLLVLVCLYTAAYFYVVANKARIIRQLTEQAGKKLNGKLTIGDADISFFRTFPKISLEIKDISLTDTLFEQHHHSFFKAKELYANLNIFKLIRKEPALSGLRIDNGSVYLFTDTTGYTNTYLLKGKKDPQGGPKRTTGDINLKNIDLVNMVIIQDDRKKQKFHEFDVHSLNVGLSDEDSLLVLHNSADILVKSLAFCRS